MGSHDPVKVFAFIALGLALTAFTFGPMGSALTELFPTAVRYTGASMAFNPCLRKWIIWAVRPTMTRTKTDPKAPTRIGDFGSVTSG